MLVHALSMVYIRKLIIKNNLIPRKIVRVALANTRFKVGAFIDGAGARMAIPNESPDLIPCDLRRLDVRGRFRATFASAAGAAEKIIRN